MNVELSVVVPTYNRATYLNRLLESLERQSVSPEIFEVVVVDDGSNDATPEVIARPRGYRLVGVQQPNSGPAAARNNGIRRASGEIILFVDDDTITTPDLIATHLEAQRARPGAVIGRMLAADTHQPIWAAWESRVLEKQYEDMASGRWSVTARQFYTANASVQREALLRAGLFNEDFLRAEDVELAYRLDDLGVAFSFCPEAVIRHDTPRSLSAWMRVPQQYGHYDVKMWTESGRNHIPSNIADEMQGRHAAVRALSRAAVGRTLPMLTARALGPALIQSLRVLRLQRAGYAACSVLFNLLYLDSVCHEVGGRATFWAALAKDSVPLAPQPGALKR